MLWDICQEKRKRETFAAKEIRGVDKHQVLWLVDKRKNASKLHNLIINGDASAILYRTPSINAL